eukprot:TRINITY_DN31223_c0_g3_i1.p1 TRINITY_DN31223_c0_g3~~TRINITY_DN31223_c0_g3_i1.p1  ORF type:complete len:330 (+),score=49.40 TRINITY_DN31223_c0_g3_i1:89-1078(+)
MAFGSPLSCGKRKASAGDHELEQEQEQKQAKGSCGEIAVKQGSEANGFHRASAAGAVTNPAARRRVTGKRPASLHEASVCMGALSEPSTSELQAQRKITTLVINLDRRKDRWESCETRLRNLDPLLDIQRVPATDGVADDVPLTAVGQEWTTERNGKYDGRKGYQKNVTLQMTPGERGCAMSHVRAWRIVAESDNAASCRPFLILEDDAVPTPSFAKHIGRKVARASEEKADILYLGYIKGAPWRRKVEIGLYEAEYLWTTVGYVLWPSGARKLLDLLPVDEPVDNFMAWQISQNRLLALATVPEIVKQELEWDQASDVPHSDDAAFTS